MFAFMAVSHALEYGTDWLEMHADALVPGAPVVIDDDLLASGGTAAAAVDLVARAGGRVVGCGFLIELGFLAGRTRLGSTPVRTVLAY